MPMLVSIYRLESGTSCVRCPVRTAVHNIDLLSQAQQTNFALQHTPSIQDNDRLLRRTLGNSTRVNIVLLFPLIVRMNANLR